MRAEHDRRFCGPGISKHVEAAGGNMLAFDAVTAGRKMSRQKFRQFSFRPGYRRNRHELFCQFE